MFKKNLALYVSYSVLMAAATVGTMTMQPAEKITSLMTHLMPQGDKTEHILTHVSGTEQDKAELKKALNTLSRTQIGREILSQVPKDIHYVFEETHPSASGTYSKPKKTIKLYREHMTEEILYQNGEKTCSSHFDSAGILTYKTEFVDGHPKTEKEYDTDGSLWYEVEFVNGQPSIEKEYDKDGKVVHMQPFNQTAKANTEAAPGSLKKMLNKMEQLKTPLLKKALQNTGR